jgi:homoserine acetyltransferase
MWPHAGMFDAGDVVLQSGSVFKDARIAFELHGTMNLDKSNIILVHKAVHA